MFRVSGIGNVLICSCRIIVDASDSPEQLLRVMLESEEYQDREKGGEFAMAPKNLPLLRRKLRGVIVPWTGGFSAYPGIEGVGGKISWLARIG